MWCHAFSPSLRRQKQADLHDFKASLDYRTNSRTARATSKTLSKTERKRMQSELSEVGGWNGVLAAAFLWPRHSSSMRGQMLARMPHPDGVTGRRWESQECQQLRQSQTTLGKVAHASLRHRLQPSLGSTVRPCLREGEKT